MGELDDVTGRSDELDTITGMSDEMDEAAGRADEMDEAAGRSDELDEVTGWAHALDMEAGVVAGLETGTDRDDESVEELVAGAVEIAEVEEVVERAAEDLGWKADTSCLGDIEGDIVPSENSTGEGVSSLLGVEMSSASFMAVKRMHSLLRMFRM